MTSNTKPNQQSQAVTRLTNQVRQLKRQAKHRKNNPVSLRSLSLAQTVNYLNNYHEYTRAQYLYGLIHPEVAVSDGLQLKLYSDVPLPTNSAGIRETFYVTPNANGCFALAWAPAYFATRLQAARIYQPFDQDISNFEYSHTYVNTSAQLDGQAPDQGHWTPMPSYVPTIDINKYRLVSALLRVKYVGSVLNQSGMLYSAATYNQIPVSTWTQGSKATSITSISSVEITSQMASQDGKYTVDPGASSAYMQLTRFSDFSLTKNGLWNFSHNITQDANGIECLYIPMDPLDSTFKDVNSYYGTPQYYETPQPTHNETIFGPITVHSGTPINYVVTGQNIVNPSQCILVEAFYNFECIADPSTAPFLRSSYAGGVGAADTKMIGSAIREVASQTGLIRKAQGLKQSFFDFLKSHTPSLITKAISLGKGLAPIIRPLLTSS